jgi:von Willebrand factor type A domain
MRMPSTTSPWLPLVCSFALHGLLVLGGWFFMAGQQRSALQWGVCVADASTRLKLSVIFDGDGAGKRPAKVDTKVEEPAHNDTTVKLVESLSFNPPVEVSPVPINSGRGTITATGAGGSGSGGVPVGPGSGGQSGASFYQIGTAAHRIVYVLDRSLSMGDAFSRVLEELQGSLQQLPSDAQFQVLVYNEEPQFLLWPERLLPAQPEIKERCVQVSRDLRPRGRTNHLNALRRAVSLNPEVIFFVTDADDLPLKDVQIISGLCCGKIAIHVVEMTSGGTPPRDSPLMRLAEQTHGTYRAVGSSDRLTAIPGPPP